MPAAEFQALVDRAKAMRIEDDAVRRGAKLRRQGRELVGPCPRCGGYDRFAIHTTKQIWNCRGCGTGGDVLALVQHVDGVGFVEAVHALASDASPNLSRQIPVPPHKPADDDYEREQHAKAAWLWSQRRSIAGSIAERYLREARGYTGSVPPTLGFLPPTKLDHHPALIASFALVGEVDPGMLGAPQTVGSVHLTLLRLDGNGKAEVDKPKIAIGSPRGRPITLAPPNDLLGLAITEGIEDGLTAYASTGLGVWAAGSAGFMPALADAVPNYIDCITIYAHADPAGRRGATELAERLHQRGFEVFIEGLQ
jgi:hypothetical protein